MLHTKGVFQRNIQQADQLGALYGHLSTTVPMPEQFEDLLRSQIVYAVSAFDKLIHDLIRIGMVQIFESQRLPTSKYLGEPIPIQYLPQLAVGMIPPPAFRFEEIIREKLSKLSFQDPVKIADGLSYIWNESQKWQKIALGLGIPDEDLRRKLKLIVTRRNAIVHEADINPVSNQKQSITQVEAADASSFLFSVGNQICALVT